MSIEQTAVEESHACGCGGACGGGGAARAQADAAAEAATGGARRDLGLVAASAVAPGAASQADSSALEPSVGLGPDDLDARAIPRTVRRAALIAAVGALAPGQRLVIAADHDPAHLRDVLGQELGQEIGWTYLLRGPELWRVEVAPAAR